MLLDVVHQQASRLSRLPLDLATAIRRSLMASAQSGRLHRDWYSTEAYIRRLPDHRALLDTAMLLYWTIPIDLALHVLTFIAVASALAIHGTFRTVGATATAILLVSHVSLYLPPLALRVRFMPNVAIGVFAAVIGVEALKHLNSSVMSAAAIAGYTAAWAPSARIVAHRGTVVPGPFWLMAPFVVVRWRWFLRVALFGGATLWATGAVWSIGWEVPALLDRVVVLVLVLPLVFVLVPLMAMMFGVAAVVVVSSRLARGRQRLIDWVRRKTWRMRAHGGLPADQIFETLAQYGRPHGRACFVRSLRTSHLFVCDECACESKRSWTIASRSCADCRQRLRRRRNASLRCHFKTFRPRLVSLRICLVPWRSSIGACPGSTAS